MFTIELKYMVVVETTKKTLWLRLLEELNIEQNGVQFHCDNQKCNSFSSFLFVVLILFI